MQLEEKLYNALNAVSNDVFNKKYMKLLKGDVLEQTGKHAHAFLSLKKQAMQYIIYKILYLSH